MSTTSPHIAASPVPLARSRGRGYFWAGFGLCLLALLLGYAQFFALKILVVPWYLPALTTLGAFLLLVSVVRRQTIPRILGLLLVAGFAAFQWYFLVTVLKLPAYDGPVQAGKQIPSFTSSFADGRSFTEANLRDGSRRALVFFRGRW
jgi:hypothetical protein